jgi:uncharacterized protein (TIGR00255 family)
VKENEPHSTSLVSMTGYGRALVERAGVQVSAEIRALNHRSLDIIVRIPPSYAALEAGLRSKLSARLLRGRVEITVTRERIASAENSRVQINNKLFEELFEAYAAVFRRHHAFDHSAEEKIIFEILRRTEVVAMSDEQISAAEPEMLDQALEQALLAFEEMRFREGARLKVDLEKRFDELEMLQKKISAQREDAVRDVQRKLLERIRTLSSEINLDPARVVSEVALIVDRGDITEELVRLKSHLSEARNSFYSPAGRKFEFLCQELQRECSTIGSKAQDAGIQKLVIDAKLEIERIREQSANIV